MPGLCNFNNHYYYGYITNIYFTVLMFNWWGPYNGQCDNCKDNNNIVRILAQAIIL